MWSGQVCTYLNDYYYDYKYIACVGSHNNVEKIITLAVKHDVCVIPFGGGTNVSGALECPEEERRTIVSLDMTQMVISVIVYVLCVVSSTWWHVLACRSNSKYPSSLYSLTCNVCECWWG